MSDPHSRLSAKIADFGKAVVLVVGDVMLDRFVSGAVERISPEAPIPVMQVKRETTMLGGAGNVVRNLVALTVGVRFCSLIGNDATGFEVQRLLADLPKVTSTLEVEEGRPTTLKVRFVAQSQQLLRTDHETTRPLTAEAEARILDEVRASLPGAGVVVLSDYGKGLLTASLVRDIIAEAYNAGIPVIVDPKGRDYQKYRGASLVSPNRKELHEATGLAVGSDAEVVEAARTVMATTGITAVLATRSEDGMTLVQDDAIHHFPAQAREVFDVSGAGDTALATLAAGVAAGIILPEATELANVAAGIVVGKIGTAVVSSQELIAGLRHQELDDAEAKVLYLSEAIGITEQWRRRGQKVGFTNGCFDLLHPGHLALLRQARAACDRLVVGLNSDASVKRLKGETRPIQNEMARAAVLASLAGVDAVVIFGDDTPYEVIKALRPDVLVKGADYTVETVVGADLVLGWGGQVVLATLEPGQSTTATISRMAKS